MHCFRLMHMAGEIAEGRQILLERTEDRGFLMDVRNHKYEYDEIIALLEQEKERMEVLVANSTIPEAIDREFVNALMIDIRERQLRMF